MDDQTLLIVIIAGFVAWIILSYFFFRWIFSIKRQLWNQKTVINLLIKIAEKQGVPLSEMDIIHRINNNPEAEFHLSSK